MTIKLSMAPREDGQYRFYDLSDLADDWVYLLENGNLTADEIAVAESDLRNISQLVESLGWGAGPTKDLGLNLRISGDEYLDYLIPERDLNSNIEAQFFYVLESLKTKKSIFQHLKIDMESAKSEYSEFVINDMKFYSRKNTKD